MDVDPEQIGEIARAFSDFGPEGITDTLAALSGGRSPLGFTSRLDEVLSTFRPTDTVTLDTLSKKGVKKAELEARGLISAPGTAKAARPEPGGLETQGRSDGLSRVLAETDGSIYPDAWVGKHPYERAEEAAVALRDAFPDGSFEVVRSGSAAGDSAYIKTPTGDIRISDHFAYPKPGTAWSDGGNNAEGMSPRQFVELFGATRRQTLQRLLSDPNSKARPGWIDAGEWKRLRKEYEALNRASGALLDNGKSAKVSDLQEVAGKNQVEVREQVYGGKDAVDDGDLLMDDDIISAGGVPKAKWSEYSLDPSNPTYRETVLHLPSEHDVLKAKRGALRERAERGEIAADDYYAQADPITRDLDSVPKDFQSGHWSEPNVIAHARTSIQKDAQGKDVFVVNELQSDWGQKLRDGGVRDEAKIAELRGRTAEANDVEKGIVEDLQSAAPDGDRIKTSTSDARDRLSQMSAKGDPIGLKWKDAWQTRQLLNAELRTAEAAASGHPLVNTTDQWVNTGLRKMIMEAVESGSDQIAIPSGDTVLAFGMGGKSDGVKYAYDQMYPKNLRNILKKIDPSIEPQKVDHLYGQQGQTLDRSQGFVTFKITDNVRSSIQSEGMPLFAVGGGRIEPPRRGPEVSPEILGLAQAIATRFGMEMPDLAAKSFDDQISLLEKFLGQAEKVAQKGLKTATGEMQDILNQLDELRFFANANRQELEDIANETIAKITGSPAGRMINPFDSEFLQGKAGPLQARTLRIPDLHISDKGHAFADFLDDDIERVASSYVRSMAPDIALTREFGDLNLTETLRQIEDEAARLSEAQPGNSAQIQKQKTKDMRDLQDIVKRLRGTYNVNHDPSAWGPWTARRLKEWNVLRLMGAVVVSSIPDVMRLLMVHGFRNNADVFRTFAVDLKSLRIPKDQAKEMSAGLEFVMSKAGPMWDAFDDFGGHSRFDQTMQAATKKFGRLSLMDAWNSTLKQLSGAMTTSRVLRAAVELSEGRISPKDLRKLAKSGISEDMALEIAKQYKQHGGMHGHLWLANANAWDQTDLAKRAAQALRAAVRKEADITIVTPGQEKPLWTSTHVGSVLAQFRTFQLVSVQRTLIPAVQEADAAIIVAVAGMIGLGMLSERLKQIVHGKKGGPETTGDWLYAGVANSGVLGWITDADQTLHKASRGNVSAARLLFGSDRPISRFASQNVTGSMLGPSFGAGQDLVTAFGGATTGDLSQGDIRAMRRLLPYQNLFYLSRALRAGEQGAMEAAGVPERRAN